MADKDTWSFKPDGSSEGNSTKKANKAGDFSWTASEYIDHNQSASWYLGLVALTIIITAGIYFITKDLVAVILIPLVAVAVGIFAHRTPQQLAYKLSADGLEIGAKSYPYSLFKSFAIIADGGLISLYLEPIKRFMPPVSAYFAPADHEKVFEILQQYLPYEERQLDLTERLTRRLHF